MIKKILPILLLISCSSRRERSTLVYPQAIGNIEYNNALDGDFKRCGFYPLDTLTSFTNSYYGIHQGFQYEGEMYAIKEHFKKYYKSPNIKGESGFITIRFLVNCHGETGMFRTSSIDFNLSKRIFSPKIQDQLLVLTKELKMWKVLDFQGGNIIDIAP